MGRWGFSKRAVATQVRPWLLVRVCSGLLLVGAFMLLCMQSPRAISLDLSVTEKPVILGTAATASLNQLRNQLAVRVTDDVEDDKPVSVSVNPSHKKGIGPKQNMKIFVYDMPAKFTDLVLVRNPHCEGEAFGTEIHIHQQMLRSPHRTLNPDEADLFYVPVYSACVVYANFRHFPEYRRLISDSLEFVQQNHPYWNRTKGQDHVYAFVHDYGGCLSWLDNLEHVYFKDLHNSIFLSHLGDLSMGCFSPQKDIVIPPMSANEKVYRLGRGGAGPVTDVSVSNGKQQATIRPRDKPIFAYFRGTIRWYHSNDIPDLKITRGYSKSYSKGIRMKIQELYSNDPLFFINEGPSSDYVGEVRNSTFCLCPRGFAPWSQRLYDSIMLGCIPVIIADDIVLPWEDVVDYRSFTVKVDERDLTRLKHILLSIPAASIAAKQAKMREVYNMFSYQRPSEHGDAFDMLMRQLSAKVLRHRPAGPDAWK